MSPLGPRCQHADRTGCVEDPYLCFGSSSRHASSFAFAATSEDIPEKFKRSTVIFQFGFRIAMICSENMTGRNRRIGINQGRAGIEMIEALILENPYD